MLTVVRRNQGNPHEIRRFDSNSIQMNNMEHILKNVAPNSMVVNDELCRSTNPKESAQLAWNLCEHLAAIHGNFNDDRYFISDENDVCPMTQSSNSEVSGEDIMKSFM